MDNTGKAIYDVVVLIPHYNNLDGLIKSLGSIYYEESIMILVVDDGSILTERPVLQQLTKVTDYPVVLRFLQKNEGIEAALNLGISEILKTQNAKYIARLDCGDIMVRDRLKLQVSYLNENKNIYLLGSWVDFIQQGKRLFSLKLPKDHSTIRKQMMYKVCFIHPAVTFRVSGIDKVGYYPTDYPAAEDYAFFYRFVESFETANLQKVLTIVESNLEGISLSHRRLQLRSRLKVLLDNPKISILWIVGVIKIKLLQIVPNSIIISIKQLIYR
ncbi:MAG TPA: glycosyltransferase [Fulvivirga sp.]|nr:glycosyltransferase [Fulvivirga sp.]